MTAPRCDQRLPGRKEPCHAPMRETLDALGRVRWVCVRCAARLAGRCWQCGRPRTNDRARGVYCGPCGYAAYRTAQRRSEAQECRKKKRARYDAKRWRDADVRAKRLEQQRAWLAANPERVREYKRRDWQRHKAKAAARRQASVSDGAQEQAA